MKLDQAISTTLATFKRNSRLIHRGTWQAVDVHKRPEMETHELVGHSVRAELGTRALPEYQRMIKPDLPWADDHFAERVSGKPLNPPPSEAWWPHAPEGNQAFKENEWGPVRTPSDWAYLAGFIDGEGSLLMPDDNRKRHARIKITQVDRPSLTRIYENFGVGTLRESPYFGPLSIRPTHIWRISKREEVRWVLRGVLPYLQLKKEKALQVLNLLPDRDGRSNDEDFGKLHKPMFSHTYPERLWVAQFPGNRIRGVRFHYGDLNDLVNLLRREPFTRQAYIPIWFPEDTGNVMNQRTPCTLGYHFLRTDNSLDTFYFIRSCDLLRHFHNDIYMTIRLTLWIIDQLSEHKNWQEVLPRNFYMHIGSLHCFRNDWEKLFGQSH